MSILEDEELTDLPKTPRAMDDPSDDGAVTRDFVTSVLDSVVAHFLVRPNELRRKAGKAPHIIRARHFASYFLRRGGMSYPLIAQHLNYDDHTSVMYGVRRIANLIADGDRKALRDVQELEKRIHGQATPIVTPEDLRIQVAALEVQLRDAHAKIGKLCEWLGIDKDSM